MTINRNYDGNPLCLNAFINSIELLKELSHDGLRAIFLRFIISKLEGKALESIPANPADVNEIITALSRQIQPDNSKVVAGRLLALRPDRSKLAEFSEQAEKLADSLQRSLIIEGISQAKAREMSIDKTVEVCRGAARSDLVKSVLASTKFDSPKEVIAKYVVESATEDKEKQILAYRAFQRQNNNRGNRGGYNHANRYHSNGNRGRDGTGNRFGNNYSGRNTYSGRNNYGGNNRNYTNRGSSNSNNRGRGNFFPSPNNTNGYRSNENNRNIRYTENCEDPQPQLREAQNRN